MNAMKSRRSALCFHSGTALAIAVVLGAGVPYQNVSAQTGENQASTTAASIASAEDVLAFRKVLQRAMRDNPGVSMADARIEQASERARQSGSFRYPKIEVSATAGPEHNDPSPTAEAGHDMTYGRNMKLTVSRTLFDGGTLRSEFERSQRLQGASRAEALIVVEELFLAVSRHYIDYWRYQHELEQANNFVEAMQSLVDKLNSMYRAGAASKLEVDFARSRLAAARGIGSAASASLNNAFSELEYLVPGLTPFKAQSPESFSRIELLPLSDYLEQGALYNSGFITNQLSQEATQLRVKAQKGRFSPTIDFEFSGSVIDDEGGPTQQRDKVAAKLVLNYTFFSGGERRGGVGRAEAQLRELQAERVQLERDVFREIDQSYNNITASRLSLAAVSDEIEANQELQRLNRENLARGTINIIELIDVEERLFNAQSRKNEVVATLFQEFLKLSIASGQKPELLLDYLPESFNG